jgi:hypothetical protein
MWALRFVPPSVEDSHEVLSLADQFALVACAGDGAIRRSSASTVSRDDAFSSLFPKIPRFVRPGPPHPPGEPFSPHAPRSSLVHHGPISDVPCRIAGASRKLPEPTPDLHSPRVSRRSASVVYPALPDAVVTRPCLRGERVTAPKRLPSSIGPSNLQFEVHPRRSPGLEKGRGSRTRFAPPSPRDRVERISRFFRS